MSCCIGGVCIPYTAIVPLCLIGLQWVASQCVKLGILPERLAKKWGIQAESSSGSSTDCADCCCGDKSGRIRSSRSKTSKKATSETFLEVPKLLHIDSLEQWKDLGHSSDMTTLIVKFTADWCKPCKAIHPHFVSLANSHSTAAANSPANHAVQFVTVDVDGDDCDVLSSEYNVVMMPTFIALRSSATDADNVKQWTELGRFTNGIIKTSHNDMEHKLTDWVQQYLP